jgi:hypothetical protein
VSACYGARTPAPVCDFAETATGAQDFITFLIPPLALNGADVARVRELEATGGRAFEIAGGTERHELLLLNGDESYVESVMLASDFAWSWARFSQGGAQLEELVLVGGRRLSLGGREIIGLPARAAYLVARREGDQLLFETEAGTQSVMLDRQSPALGDLEDEKNGRLISSVVGPR